MHWFIRSQVEIEPNKQWNKFPYRQREFPFQSQTDNPYNRKFVPEESPDEYDSHNLYHVTTNLPAIIRDMRLKSRSQLDNNTSGLGGGARNEAANKISMTYNRNKAFEIYDDLMFVAGIVKGQIKPSAIYSRLSYHRQDAYLENETTAFDEALVWFGVSRNTILNGTDGQIMNVLDRKVKTPEQRYELFQKLEQAVISENEPNEYSDEVWRTPTTGFTMDFYNMQSLNPANIAIIQCVIRKNARVEEVADEMEIRVDPADVSVIRWMQPKT